MPGNKPEALERFRQDWLPLADQVNFNTFSPRAFKTKLPDHELTRCNNEIFFQTNIRWDGRIPLCGYQFGSGTQEWLGDLHHNSLEEIWASPRLQEVRVAHQRRQLDKAAFCRSCFVTQCESRLEGNKRRYNKSNNPLINFINRAVDVIK
jgi:hypothetical protein